MPVRVRPRALFDMAVGLAPPSPLAAVAGIRLGCACAIKSKKRDDLTAIEIIPGATVAGVFTQNRFPAPPVEICREHLRGQANNIRGLVINAGIANAGTLTRGRRDAQKSCRLFADVLGCNARQILPFSTGVIMEYLPMEKYAKGLKTCVNNLAADNWNTAAAAIMTTDTVAKGVSRRVCVDDKTYTVTGIAKGSGMIHPNMATMLAFVATDAKINARALNAWQRQITNKTFNAISVDGDTSTNDSFILIATGSVSCSAPAAALVRAAISDICSRLADAIVRDGEGASKFIRITARGGRSKIACRKMAQAIATSPLVKTALAASDANVGRLLMAAGNANIDFNPKQIQIKINNAPIIKNGGLHPQYSEAKGGDAVSKSEINIEIIIGASTHSATLTTCDLTHRYIEINADYRS